MPTSVINEILSFCPQGTIASGDIMALEDYKNDVQRLRGHQPGIARRELENMALRQSSFVAAGLAQFVAKRYAPGVRDDADLDALETAITAAITALIAAGNAQTATRLATKRTIGGVAFDGSANIHHYATCSTAAATAAKTVALAGFALATGARVLVKFTVTNSAANPTLDVNGTGAKPIQYRGAAIAAGTLAANRTYGFVYTGAQYELVGDVDTNTTYPLATASNDGLMAKGDKGKLDGIAVGAEVNQNAFGNILVGSTTIAADTKTDTLTFVAGTNVTLTPDAANDKLTIAANLGKWRPNAANPTGLYVPKLSDQFFPSLDGDGRGRKLASRYGQRAHRRPDIYRSSGRLACDGFWCFWCKHPRFCHNGNNGRHIVTNKRLQFSSLSCLGQPQWGGVRSGTYLATLHHLSRQFCMTFNLTLRVF